MPVPGASWLGASYVSGASPTSASELRNCAFCLFPQCLPQWRCPTTSRGVLVWRARVCLHAVALSFLNADARVLAGLAARTASPWQRGGVKGAVPLALPPALGGGMPCPPCSFVCNALQCIDLFQPYGLVCSCWLLSDLVALPSRLCPQRPVQLPCNVAARSCASAVAMACSPPLCHAGRAARSLLWLV